MSGRRLVKCAAVGSLALLAGAWAFQYVGGIAPCKICIWQRWPHGIAILCGIIALRWGQVAAVSLGGCAALATSAIGLYHTGIERGWWQGPSTCTGNGPASGSPSGGDLLSTADMPNIIMCDQVAWQMFGLSMASWNSLASLLLAGLWIAAALRWRR